MFSVGLIAIYVACFSVMLSISIFNEGLININKYLKIDRISNQYIPSCLAYFFLSYYYFNERGKLPDWSIDWYSLIIIAVAIPFLLFIFLDSAEKLERNGLDKNAVRNTLWVLTICGFFAVNYTYNFSNAVGFILRDSTLMNSVNDKKVHVKQKTQQDNTYGRLIGETNSTLFIWSDSTQTVEALRKSEVISVKYLPDKEEEIEDKPRPEPIEKTEGNGADDPDCRSGECTDW